MPMRNVHSLWWVSAQALTWLCRGTWSSGTVNLQSIWEVSVAYLLLFGDDMGLRKMEFLSLNLFNALKICLSGLSGIWQELWLSITFSLQQREDATPSKHSEKGQEEILWQQGFIKSYGTRRHWICDSASLEVADLSSLGVLSGLRM